VIALPRLVVLAAAAALLAACSSAEQPAAPSANSSSAPAVAAPSSVTPPPAPPPMSEKDQIVAALQAVADSYNTKNWDAYLEMQCPAVRAKFTGPIMEQLKVTRDKQGLSSFKVIDVTIDGDSAKVKVQASNETLGSQEITMPMERSDGWKLCAPNGAA
jgi:type IV pilus biogenesis protein CpaD/CtpE